MEKWQDDRSKDVVKRLFGFAQRNDKDKKVGSAQGGDKGEETDSAQGGDKDEENGSVQGVKAIPSRLQFADSFVTKNCKNRFSLIDTDTYYGEIKAENAIDAITSEAKPRLIERVPSGMTFRFRLVYNLEYDNLDNSDEYNDDMDVLAKGFQLLQLDYLGGHGSRGYGRVSFSNFKVRKIMAGTGEVTEDPTLAKRFEDAKILRLAKKT